MPSEGLAFVAVDAAGGTGDGRATASKAVAITPGASVAVPGPKDGKAAATGPDVLGVGAGAPAPVAGTTNVPIAPHEPPRASRPIAPGTRQVGWQGSSVEGSLAAPETGPTPRLGRASGYIGAATLTRGPAAG